MNKFFPVIFSLALFSCQSKTETLKPLRSNISESVYASGIVKSRNQYQAFAVVSGIIEKVFVSEGDRVQKGTPILSISNQTQRLSEDNAQLTARYLDFNANQGKLQQAKLAAEQALFVMQNDSVLYFRQKNLWKGNAGTLIDLEQRELAYQNAKSAYRSAVITYDDLRRQLDFNSQQSRNSLLISSRQAKDFTVKSEVDGLVYSILKYKGEIVNPQTPLAILGEADHFILEMQVDEYDILKVKKGQRVVVAMDSYKGKVFDATVTRIFPMMNPQSKTFLVEAEFMSPPAPLYPNITFEASIVIQTRQNALLVPRNFVLNDSVVLDKTGRQRIVKTGLKNYDKIEVISGVSADEELIAPVK
ncbi:efflux RND transporter periplasmic adaptor subunit [Dyadobacter luticola]|uniref:HlyD family efflux transporter periplasmic adaptor subunit n=1 Tax=Dyadobacter luticola TaxID=1979387 RepID=A0A5R9L268_9BACT|nr:efflux RND transporter periplasmic adaptor subunit [Dyadobacter luticola]TLV02415.1 HlyD family efflux transporter periplasmic adaptor subunit [Dyadobacter luticola]